MTWDLTQLSLWRLALICVLVIFTMYVFYRYFTKPAKSEGWCNMNGKCGERVIILFTMSWCSYCKTMKPIWDQVVQDLASTGITFVHKADDPKRPNYVNSFPSIYMYENGKVRKYNGLQNYQQLKLWCQSISQTEYQN